MLRATILVLAVLQAGQLTRATIVATRSDPPRRNFFIIYYDERLLFAARNFGDSRDFGGNTTPGLFVHSKEHGRWIRITAISTQGGTFGTSASDDPVARKKLSQSQVGWDFREYKQRPYIDQPLRTSGSIAFPDRIAYDGGTDRYELATSRRGEYPRLKRFFTSTFGSEYGVRFGLSASPRSVTPYRAD